MGFLDDPKGLFDRFRPDMVCSDKLDLLRRQHDPDTAATSYIAAEILDERMCDRHFWHAAEPIQLRLALAAIASSMARTASALRDAGSQQTGATRIPLDIDHFAQGLILKANEAIGLAGTDSERQLDWVFDDETRDSVTPDMLMPYWPMYPDAADMPLYEWQATSAGTVSSAFVRGIVRAGMALAARTYIDLDKLDATAGRPVPPELADALTHIKDDLLDVGNSSLITARDIMDEPRPSPVRLAAALEAAHSGLVDVMYANQALVAPPMLGGGFRNNQDG